MKKSESRIQQEIFVWYWNMYCLPVRDPREIIYHIPNEGKENAKLTSVGLYPGAADLIFTYKGQHYYCEVKEPERGRQSPNQKKFQKHVEQCGYKYFIVYSLHEFQQLIESIKLL